MTTRRTPKVFNAHYQPSKERDFSGYKKLWPLVLLLIVVIGLFVFFNLPYFSIQDIEIVGPTEPNAVSALSKLKGESIFSRKINSQVASIKQQDLLLSNLSCSRGIPSTLRCTDSLRSTSAIWQTGGISYAVDSEGDAFSVLPIPTAGMPIIQDKSNQPVTLGNSVASSALISTYRNMNTQLIAAGFAITNYFITDTLYQVGALTTGNPKLNWTPSTPINLLLTTSSPIPDQVATIVFTIQSKSTQITSRIDVRVPGYVYLK